MTIAHSLYTEVINYQQHPQLLLLFHQQIYLLPLPRWRFKQRQIPLLITLTNVLRFVKKYLDDDFGQGKD